MMVVVVMGTRCHADADLRPGMMMVVVVMMPHADRNLCHLGCRVGPCG
jgi:hypothetical protein